MGHCGGREEGLRPGCVGGQLLRVAGRGEWCVAVREGGAERLYVRPRVHHGGSPAPVIFEELLQILCILFLHYCTDSNGVGPVCLKRIGEPFWRLFQTKFYFVPTQLAGSLASAWGGCISCVSPQSSARHEAGSGRHHGVCSSNRSDEETYHRTTGYVDGGLLKARPYQLLV